MMLIGIICLSKRLICISLVSGFLQDVNRRVVFEGYHLRTFSGAPGGKNHLLRRYLPPLHNPLRERYAG